jgi:transcriptional regulator with XRE-family HTH domain
MKDQKTGEYEPRKPHALLDTVRKKKRLKTDLQLALLIGVEPSVISRIRSGRMPVSPYVILQLHDATGMDIKAIKSLL